MLVKHRLIAEGLIKEREFSQWSVFNAFNDWMLGGHQLGTGSYNADFSRTQLSGNCWGEENSLVKFSEF